MSVLLSASVDCHRLLGAAALGGSGGEGVCVQEGKAPVTAVHVLSRVCKDIARLHVRKAEWIRNGNVLGRDDRVQHVIQ